jgi:hypothetical protein
MPLALPVLVVGLSLPAKSLPPQIFANRPDGPEGKVKTGGKQPLHALVGDVIKRGWIAHAAYRSEGVKPINPEFSRLTAAER